MAPGQTRMQNGLAGLECWIFLKILHVESSYDPVVLQHTYQEEGKYANTGMFTAAPFTTAWLPRGIKRMTWPQERELP